jgi:hypothetical protein
MRIDVMFEGERDGGGSGGEKGKKRQEEKIKMVRDGEV